jgi:hypothetical protein
MTDVEVLTGPRVMLRAPRLDDAEAIFVRVLPRRQHGSARVLERAGLALEGRLVRYAMFPNLSAEPQDCLLFATALR